MQKLNAPATIEESLRGKTIVDTNMLYYEMNHTKGVRGDLDKRAHEYIANNDIIVSTASIYEFVTSNWKSAEHIVFISSFLQGRKIAINTMANMEYEVLFKVASISKETYIENIPLLKEIALKKIDIEVDYLIYALFCSVTCSVVSYSKTINGEENIAKLTIIATAAISSNSDYITGILKDRLTICYDLAENISEQDKDLVGNAERAISEIFDDCFNLILRTIIGTHISLTNEESPEAELGDILKANKAYRKISKSKAREFFSSKNFTSKEVFLNTMKTEFKEQFSANPIYAARIVYIVTSMMERARKIRKNDIFDSIILLHMDGGAYVETFDADFKRYLDEL